MRRADRLFAIIQILRRRSRAVTAAAIADELEVTARTVYRDIAALQGRGVPIEGAAGVGYLLRDGFDLPPLMLNVDELEALLIGTRIVESWADPELARAAGSMLAKVTAVVPDGLRPLAMSLAFAAPPSKRAPAVGIDVPTLRRAVREQHKLDITYLDLAERRTERTVWPLSLSFFPPVWLSLSWCELREDFRSFRIDRIERMAVREERYPQTPGRRLVDFLRRFGYQP